MNMGISKTQQDDSNESGSGKLSLNYHQIPTVSVSPSQQSSEVNLKLTAIALTNEPPHDQTNKMTHVPSKDSSAWASTQSEQIRPV